MTAKIPRAITDFFSLSQIALTLSDPTQQDDPIILANESFYRLTGYEAKDTLGKNCRFLQGKGTTQASLNTLRRDFAAGRDTKVLLRNYRKSGEPFDNYLYVFTLYDAVDNPIFRIGSQFDIPQISRAKAFLAHSEALHDGLGDLRENDAKLQLDLMEVGETIGASVKDLLTARLEHLRSA